MAKESDLERKVCWWARAHGWLALKQDPRFHAGIPDRLFVLPNGRVVWVEFKREGQNVSLIQEAVHGSLKRLGHDVYTIDNFEQALAAFSRWSRGMG